MSSLFGKLLVNPRLPGLFPRGSWFTLILTTRCSLVCKMKECGYNCPMYVDREKPAQYSECSAEEWINYFKHIHPEWISYVCISGGEPSLHDGLPDIVNYLTQRKTNVRIYTNLVGRNSNILKCYPSKYLDVWATYHHHCNRDVFLRNLQDVKLERIKIQVNEIVQPMVLEGSIYKGIYTDEAIKDFNTFHFFPDTPITKLMSSGCEAVYRGRK